MNTVLGKFKKIYVLCPALSLTGGPESMHQFIDHLRRSGHDARFVFLPDIPDPTLREFAHYDTAYTSTIEDSPDNLLIAPEVMTAELRRYQTVKKAVWWLSAVNQLKLKKERQFDWSDPESKKITHFAQSYFAEDYLRQHGVSRPLLLTDYLHHRYLRAVPATKKNQVAYFAKKNAGVIESLIARAPEISWVPIQNMTAAQVRAILSESKVYLDFGPHPGRDRMPREAAMQNCCILTGNRGAAAYPGDFPFDGRYKFEQSDSNGPFSIENEPGVIEVIRGCFDDFENSCKDFEAYRGWIMGQKQDQLRQVLSYFGINRSRGYPERIVKARNIFVFYRNKAIKKLSGYTYVEEPG